MTNIELPILFLALLVGTPTLCLLAVIIRGAKRGRQKRVSGLDGGRASSVMTSNLDPSFQHDLHSLQIDAVFNALSALIETERIKLKSLLCPVVSHLPEFEVSDQHVPEPNAEQIDDAEPDIGDEIMARNARGESAGEIANELGISKSEVALAMSMRQTIADEPKCRLEAVA